MPSSSITSDTRLVHSPSAMKRSTAPFGGFGVEIMRMRSAAMRPVSFLPLSSVTALSLVQLNLRVLDDDGQPLHLVLDEGAEFVRCVRHHVSALLRDPRAHRGLLQDRN